MPKPKILFCLHLPPPVHGSSIVGKQIAESEFIRSNFDSVFLNLLASTDIKSTGIFSFRKLVRATILFFKLIIALITLKPDTCYYALTSSGFAFWRDVLYISIVKLFRVKRVFHLHNKGFSSNHGFLYRLFAKFIFKDAKVIILADVLYNDISPYVGKKDVYVCPNGIYDVHPSLVKKIEAGDEPKILFLSNLYREKGVLDLLSACKILLERGLRFKCEIVGAEGDLSLNDVNNFIAQNNLTQIVSCLGAKYGNEKLTMLAEAEIFCLPTRNEVLPLVLLEAMRAGLPVLSTFEGGIPALIEEGVTGYLVNAKDVVSLADRLEALIRNAGLRQEMGVNARSKYLQNYTAEAFQARMVEILSCVLAV